MHTGKKYPFYTYKINGLKLEEVTIEKDLVYTLAMMLNRLYNVDKVSMQEHTECQGLSKETSSVDIPLYY